MSTLHVTILDHRDDQNLVLLSRDKTCFKVPAKQKYAMTQGLGGTKKIADSVVADVRAVSVAGLRINRLVDHSRLRLCLTTATNVLLVH